MRYIKLKRHLFVYLMTTRILKHVFIATQIKTGICTTTRTDTLKNDR